MRFCQRPVRLVPVSRNTNQVKEDLVWPQQGHLLFFLATLFSESSTFLIERKTLLTNKLPLLILLKMYLHFHILGVYLGREEAEAQRDKCLLLLIDFGLISYLSLSSDEPASNNQASSTNVVANLPRLHTGDCRRKDTGVP